MTERKFKRELRFSWWVWGKKIIFTIIIDGKRIYNILFQTLFWNWSRYDDIHWLKTFSTAFLLYFSYVLFFFPPILFHFFFLWQFSEIMFARERSVTRTINKKQRAAKKKKKKSPVSEAIKMVKTESREGENFLRS